MGGRTSQTELESCRGPQLPNHALPCQVAISSTLPFIFSITHHLTPILHTHNTCIQIHMHTHKHTFSPSRLHTDTLCLSHTHIHTHRWTLTHTHMHSKKHKHADF